jgi:hypothetical protein
MKKIISQREAHRLLKQVRKQAQTITSFEWLIRRIRRGGSEESIEIYKDGSVGSSLAWTIHTAQKLGHLVVARHTGANEISYRALPLPSEDIKP